MPDLRILLRGLFLLSFIDSSVDLSFHMKRRIQSTHSSDIFYFFFPIKQMRKIKWECLSPSPIPFLYLFTIRNNLNCLELHKLSCLSFSDRIVLPEFTGSSE